MRSICILAVAVFFAVVATHRQAVAVAGCSADHPVLTLYSPKLAWPSGVERRLRAISITVKLAINSRGVVEDGRIDQSSGIAGLDRAAIIYTLFSTYAPASKQCSAVPGTLEVQVTLDPDLPNGPSTGCPLLNHDPVLLPKRVPEQALGVHQQTALIAVSLSSKGEVLASSLQESSGSDAVDRSALITARMAAYVPTLHLCQSVPSTLTARFSEN
ncbi:MAG: TonB family protein [Candidatus Eremiobacteraeota bacterium]|nr:TonB family protein [Candidatus Eremiobacteraeota bacterium]